MPRVDANGITIEYEEFGDPAASPLLLIMGLGAQMTEWPDEFCAQLAGRDLRVIRFDNRDIGLSTYFDDWPPPSLMELMAAQESDTAIDVPYTLDDMADDAAGLLDALEIGAAHIVGASMGGMIAQLVAIRHPAKTLTLTSIMSTTSNPDLPAPSEQAVGALVTVPAASREEAIEQGVATFRSLSGPAFPFDEADRRARTATAYDRGFHPDGMARQLAAIMSAPSRVEALGSLDVPALVIHGGADPLVPVEGGRDTADALPGAELMIIDGVGHDMPVETWPQTVDAIASLTARAKVRA